MGYAKRMTEAQDLKSSGYSNVKTIIIDEYPIEKGKRYYLPSEGMLLMGIFDSIIRNRSDVKIFILGNAVEGFTTVILLILIIGGFIMLSLGVIGHYIARVYEEVKGRPKYIISRATENVHGEVLGQWKK